MSSWKLDVRIARPAQPVWDTIVDYAKTPEWQPAIKSASVEPLGPFGKGTKVKVARGNLTINFTVEECDPPRRVVMSIVQGKVTGSTSFTLKSDGDGTLVEHTLDLKLKGLMRIFAPFIGGGVKKDLQALKRRVESQPA